MKKKLQIFDLFCMKRLLGLLFLLLLCNNALAQTFCRPISETHGASGICVYSITDPGLAFDSAGLSTFATLSTDVGVLCTIQETLTLNQTAKAGDEVAVYIGSGSGLLNLSLLSTARIQARFNGSAVGSSIAVNDPLLNLALLPGNTIGLIKFKITADTNQIQFLLGGAVTVLTDFRIYDVRLDFAKPTVSGGLNQTLCSGNSTTLTATPAAGTTIAWYDSAVSTTPLITANSYTTPVLTSNTTYYIGVTRVGSCESNERVPVVITVPNPIAPVISSVGTAICSSGATQSTTLSVINPISGTTYNWYSVPSGGASLSSLPAALGGCLEANSQQTNLNGLCLLCNANNPNDSVDGDSSTAAELSVPVGLINGWIQQTLRFNNPGRAGDIVEVELEKPGGLLDISALSYITLATYNGTTYNNDRVSIDNIVDIQLLGGNRFKASIVAGAAFDRVEVRLGGLATVLTRLDIYEASYKFKTPTVTGDIALCSGETTTLTPNLTVGETVEWFDALTAGNSLATTTSYTTPALTANTTYYYEITRNGCLNSERFPIVITVDNPIAPIIAATGTTICSGTTTTLDVQAPVVGTTYKWYDSALAGNLLFTGNSFTTPVLTTNTSYYVEASIGSCTDATRTLVNVTVNPTPLAPIVASPTVTIQSGQTALLEVSTPEAGVEYDWYDAPTLGNLLTTGTSYETDPLFADTTYYIEARNTTSGCINSARTAVTVIVNKPITSCLQADNQLVTNDGVLCLSCGAVPGTATLSVDGDNSTATTLQALVGLGGYVQQNLDFASPGLSGDIIDVELGIPSGLVNIGLLSYITLESYNGVTYNGDVIAIDNSLLSVQVLGGGRFRASFAAGADFTGVQVRLGGTLSVLRELDIYGASFRYKEASISGNASPICEGQSTILTATSDPAAAETFKWYDAASGGNEISPNETYNTGTLSVTTTYYLEATRNTGTCENSVRQPVTVTVSPLPTDADVEIDSNITALCNGQVNLEPTTTLLNPVFKYYTDQTKATEILNGGSGSVGEDYAIDPVTFALTVTNLTAAGSPYQYYISVTNDDNCENDANTLKEVTVVYPTVTPLVVTPLEACTKVNLKDAIVGYDDTITYTFFDPANTPITEAAAANITVNGVYSIQAQGSGNACPSAILPVAVTINPLPSLNVTTDSEVVNIGDSVSLEADSNSTVVWYDSLGNVLPSTTAGTITTANVTLTTAGFYTYTAVASNANCSTSATVSINVVDPANCALLTERVYASIQSSDSNITGGVSDGANAIDGDTQTASTITTGLGILGIGTTWQNLQWPTTITKGTPVTIKLGSEYSGVALGQNLTVVGTKRDGSNNPIDIGSLQSVSGSLVNLLSGENTFEFTFVPADGTGPKDYDGIRIQSASLVSVIQSTKVFDAYYNQQVPQIVCQPGDVQDVFYGARRTGLGVINATVGVSDAFNAVDNDVSTYATMYSGLGVLAAADLTVAFKTPSIASDSLRIVLSKPAALLDLSLIKGFTIQPFLGNVAVGAPIDDSSSLLSLRVLPGNTMLSVSVSSQPEIYDRVRISFGGVAGVLEFLRVHTIERFANTKITGSDPDNKIVVCPGTAITLEVPSESCSTYNWYDSPVGGNLLVSGDTYTVPASLTAGTYKYYVQPVRFDCEVFSRGEITVEVRESSPENALTDITLDGATDTTICLPGGTVTLETSLSGTPSLTSPVYYWYSFDGTTSQLIAGETTPQLVVTGLTPGTYTYFVGVSGTEFCETKEADRKQITFTILRPSDENDISVDDTAVCLGDTATLTPTAPALTNAKFLWYLDANRTQPIVNNAVISGVTYTVNSSGVLTATGLTIAMSPKSYYVSVSSDTTCENNAGALQTAAIIVNDPGTPTTTSATQDFCLEDTPTVADIAVTPATAVWYSSATSTTPLLATDALADGNYYATIIDAVTG
ncbi:hypothetical protein GON26_21430, partial [Flavobacterium sp. GA093]|nr:hypothetical protein [Flavobacterium hydrocarbonoxydans]